METILGRLEDVGLYAAAHKCTSFYISTKWCGKWYSGDEVGALEWLVNHEAPGDSWGADTVSTSC